MPVDEDTIILRSALTEIWDISPNDGDKYYTIKLDELTNLTLNYGKEYQITGSKDKYIINEETHMIYYYNGITYEGEIYHTVGSEDIEK